MDMFEHVEPVIAAYQSRPAISRECDPRAAVVARQVAALISAHLPKVSVEHIGITSVPGCAGKGIVDLMVPVRDGEMDSVGTLLDRLGCQHQANRDPFPENRPMRVGSWDYDGELFLLNIHVILAVSPEVEELRFFRACLRADAELLKLYVARRRQIIADGVTDPIDFCYGKGKSIKEVLR